MVTHKPMAKEAQRPIEFITPPNVLRAKLATDKPSIKNPLASANKALSEMAHECTQWLHDEIDQLHQHRLAFAASPKKKAALEALTISAMEIKGLATPGGCEDADVFATSLITLLTSPGNHGPANVGLVEAHVDAIRTARDKTHSPKVAAALAEELRARTNEIVTPKS